MYTCIYCLVLCLVLSIKSLGGGHFLKRPLLAGLSTKEDKGASVCADQRVFCGLVLAHRRAVVLRPNPRLLSAFGPAMILWGAEDPPPSCCPQRCPSGMAYHGYSQHVGPHHSSMRRLCWAIRGSCMSKRHMQELSPPTVSFPCVLCCVWRHVEWHGKASTYRAKSRGPPLPPFAPVSKAHFVECCVNPKGNWGFSPGPGA
jgi:hypothetical protein